VFCTEQDQARWIKGRQRLQRYHSQADRPPLEAGSGWIAHRDDAHPCEVFFFGDVCALTGEQILSEVGRTSDQIGCVFGGPPCQGFSKAGRRQTDDPRNELVFEFMRVVCEIHPLSFVMENVPGMLDMVTRDGVPVVDALAMIARDGGMGTFEAIRRSLLESAGAGAALRTMTANSRRRQPVPGLSGAGHITVEEDQLNLFG
jgi:DNA (cytosine-5)-methyltransferase 1